MWAAPTAFSPREASPSGPSQATVREALHEEQRAERAGNGRSRVSSLPFPRKSTRVAAQDVVVTMPRVFCERIVRLGLPPSGILKTRRSRRPASVAVQATKPYMGPRWPWHSLQWQQQ